MSKLQAYVTSYIVTAIIGFQVIALVSERNQIGGNWLGIMIFLAVCWIINYFRTGDPSNLSG